MRRICITNRDRREMLPIATLSPLQRAIICILTDPRSQSIQDVIRRFGRPRSTVRSALNRWLEFADFRQVLNSGLAKLSPDRRDDIRDAIYHFCLSTSLRELCNVPHFISERSSGWHRERKKSWTARQNRLLDDWINTVVVTTKLSEEGT